MKRCKKGSFASYSLTLNFERMDKRRTWTDDALFKDARNMKEMQCRNPTTLEMRLALGVSKFAHFDPSN